VVPRLPALPHRNARGGSKHDGGYGESAGPPARATLGGDLARGDEIKA
jgi:hypothetical protein